MAVDVVLKDRDGNELNVKLYRYNVRLYYYDEVDDSKEAYITLEFYSTNKLTNTIESVFNALSTVAKICYIEDTYNGENGAGIIYKVGNNIWFDTYTQNLTVDKPYNSGVFSIDSFSETLV